VKILISHATEDEPVAALLKELIERCSLKQIEVWFSSDQSAAGGIPLGASWFSDLLLKLSATDLIVALITPKSASSPWLYFECGMVANKGKGAIVPLTLGLSISDLPMPLSAYQGYDLSASTSVATFLQKLFAMACVPYDEDMTRGIRENVARALLHASEEAAPSRSTIPTPFGKTEFEDLKGYLDKRFLELHARLQVPSGQVPQDSGRNEEPILMVASLRFECVNGKKIAKEFRVELNSNSSIQDVLNECYYKMDGLVPAYQYLERWVVVENQTGKHLMSKGHTDDAPASAFFSPAQSYSIMLLDKPIDPNNSSEIRWINTSDLQDPLSIDAMITRKLHSDS
jgi:TIR domain